ncbi:MAG TPA: mannose-1-phosphate guanylyltransferase/mannose-6-phosphate isomerase [Sphingobium sp.]
MPLLPVSLTPVILSGGSGTRLWPLSRPERPKQFLALTAEETMLALTLARTIGMEGAARPIIVANQAHGDLVEEQAGGDAIVILEPHARNTAPAIALAALAVEDPATTLLVMPSDHVIADVPAFHQAISRALPLVADGWLVTLGITPDGPETGYGYIALGESLADGVQRVDRFVEKPDLERAEAMLAAGNHVWNAGIFLFRADAYLAALAEYRPDILDASREAMANATRDGIRITPDSAAFARSASESIDYAVMERADRVGCVPVEMGWSDLGSWDALHAIAARDGQGNAAAGASTLIDTQNCLVRSDGPNITLVGVEDLIVVATGNEVLIVPRGQSQLVKKAAEAAAVRLAGIKS